MVTKDEALKLALEALKKGKLWSLGWMTQKEFNASIAAIEEALAQPEQEPTANGITVDLLERLSATLTNLGYATPEGGLEAFGADLATQLYNLCQTVDGLLEKALAQPAQEPVTHTINSTRSAAVATDHYWIPIDENTPRGVKLQLLGQGGVAQYSNYHGDSFWSHWAPLPKRRD